MDKFIQLYRAKGNSVSTSSLRIHNKTLLIVGTLHHNMRIEPKTLADAQRLKNWIDNYINEVYGNDSGTKNEMA